MEKYIYNEQNGLWFELQGDYYLPCLKLPEEPEVHIGIWGQRHRRYLKSHRRALYTSLLTSGKLNSYLADINRQAEELFSRLVKQIAESENINEELKATDTTAWIGKMNNVRNRAAEVVSEEIIYK
ncbi:TnpV protein [Pseudoflavonifractor sp. MSJ-30]|uniref:TnpV protein n=1 Tax=Pseudoflavonifractor sp. MSJ-30 TaxID=2841525 RepID=UPI001C0FB922|nr:TnpV protein [Pseudoflavonifractor sp. MSJ-30]MBU5453085.1 TnpV protein [Pseudoflavonifractor sp. MSJ-30]